MKQVYMVVLDHGDEGVVKSYLSEKGEDVIYKTQGQTEITMRTEKAEYILRYLEDVNLSRLKSFNLNGAIVCNSIKDKIPEDCLLILKSCVRMKPVTEEIIYI